MCIKSDNKVVTILNDLCIIVKKNGVMLIIILFLMGALTACIGIIRDFTNSHTNSTQTMVNVLEVVGNKYGEIRLKQNDIEQEVYNLQLSLGVINNREKVIEKKVCVLNSKIDKIYDKIENLKTVTVYEGQITRAQK